MKYTLIGLLFILAICGCTKYWYQPDTSFAQCKSDLEYCRNELSKYSDMTQIGSYEREFVANCMKEKGYELVPQDKLPMKVKREEPETSLYWRLNGTAGTLTEEKQ